MIITIRNRFKICIQSSWIDNGWTIIEPINLEMEALVATSNELSVSGSKSSRSNSKALPNEDIENKETYTVVPLAAGAIDEVVSTRRDKSQMQIIDINSK